MRKRIGLLRGLAQRLEPILTPDEKLAFADAVRVMGHAKIAYEDSEREYDDATKEKLFKIWIKEWPIAQEET